MAEPKRNPYDLELAAKLYDDFIQVRADLEIYVDLAREFGGPVLEIACGTGRCLIPLIQDGFDVVGIDSSQPMLDRLAAKLEMEPEEVRHRATPILGDAGSISLPLSFGMALMAVNSFVCFLSKEEQEQFVANVFAHLRPGGILAIDTFNPSLDRLLNRTTTTKVAGEYSVVTEDLREHRASQTVDVRTTYRRRDKVLAQVEWSLRYTFRFELEHLLEKAGFKIVHLWGGHGRVPFEDSSDRLFVVAQKPDYGDGEALEAAQAVVARVGQA